MWPDRILKPRAPMVAVGLGWVTALLLMHHPMIFSGLARMQADLGDSRLNNYFLEHTWRVLTHWNDSFWNPTFFYPQKNVAAYSDLMLSFAPFYWCWRMIGIAPDTAFQLWMMSGTTLNFFVALYWLRSCCKAGWNGAIIGAVFFAAAGPRATQLGHQQLQWQLFPMLLLIAVFKIFQTSDRKSAPRWWALAGFGIVAQFYGGFYSGWFIMLGLGIAAMLAILHRNSRRSLAAVMQRDFTAIATIGLLAACLLAPAAAHYLDVKNDLGGHPYEEIRYRLATPASWIFPGPFSLERTWLNRVIALPSQKLERALSLGFFTSIMVVTGLWIGRQRTGALLLAITGLTIICLATGLHDRYCLWWVAYNTVPGAEVIRAPARIGLLLLIPAALRLAYFIDAVRPRRVWLAITLLICLIEQATQLPSFDKQQARDRISAVTNALPQNAKCFFYVGNKTGDGEYFQIDAMWAGLATGIPTLNGYSGSSPIGWNLGDDTNRSGSADRMQRAMANWTAIHSIDRKNVAWLQADAR